MIIIACRLFLREIEVASMHCDDVVPDITSVQSNGHVEGIAFKIKGKSDIHPVTLMMCDPSFPCLCPVNALLAWMAIPKIQSGYLFPSFSFITENVGSEHWDGSVPNFSDVMHTQRSWIDSRRYVEAYLNVVVRLELTLAERLYIF
jgi:hypothetical protein